MALVAWRSWPLPAAIGEAWVGAHHAQDSVLHALSLDVLLRGGLADDATPWLRPHGMVRGLTDQMPVYAPIAALLSRIGGSPLAGYHLLTLWVLLLNGLSASLLFGRLVGRGPALLGASLLVMQPWMGLHLPRVQLLSLWPLLLGLTLLLSADRAPWKLGLGLALTSALAWGTGLILASFAVPGLLIATLVVARARSAPLWGAAGCAGVIVGSASMWPLIEVHARVRDAYPFPDLGPIRDAWAEGTLPLLERSHAITAWWAGDAHQLEQALFPGAVVLVVGALAGGLRLLGRLDVLIEADSVLVKPMALVRGLALLLVLGVGLLQRDLGAFGWGLLLVALIGPLLAAPPRRRALAADLFALLALAGVMLGLGSLVPIGEHAYRTPLYWLAEAVPLFDGVRTPHRFFVFAHLGFLGLVVLAVDLLTERSARAARWVALLGTLALLDVTPAPAEVRLPPDPTVAAPSLSALAERRDEHLLIHLPFRATSGDDHGLETVEAERMLWQRVHAHPMLNGFAGFLPPVADRLLHDRLEHGERPELALHALDVRYVHLEWDRMDEAQRQRWGRWVVNTDGLQVLAESERDLLASLDAAPAQPSPTRLVRSLPTMPAGCWLAAADGFETPGRSAIGGLLRDAPTGAGASLELRCQAVVRWEAITLAADQIDHMSRAVVIERHTPTGWSKVRTIDELLPWTMLARPGAGPTVVVELGIDADRLRIVDASPAGHRWHVVAAGGVARSVPGRR